MGEPGKPGLAAEQPADDPALRLLADRRREEQLRTLGLSVAALIADAETTPSAIASVVRTICESEGWECGRYLRPQDAATLRMAGGWGIADRAVQTFLERSSLIEFRADEGLIGEVWKGGVPLWAADVTQDVRAKLRGMSEAFMPRGAFLFPVRSGGATIGVLAFNSRERREPDERLLSVILAIGSQIGQFLERKRAEEELRLSEGHLRTVVESANEGILAYDRHGRIVSANSAAERILGVPKADLIGAPGFVSRVPCFEENGTRVDPAARSSIRVLESGARIVNRVLALHRADGSITWITANTAPLFAAGETAAHGVVTTITDITRLKRDEALLRLQGRVSQAFDAPQDARSALAEAIQAVCEGEGWDCGRYLEVVERELIGFADWSVDDPAIAQYVAQVRTQRYPPGMGLVGKVWQSREPMWVLDIRSDPRAKNRSLALEMGATSALVVPVLAQDAVIGVFIFHSRRERTRDERLLQSMQLIGAQIGQLVRRAKAEEAMRLSEARFRILATHDALTGLPNRAAFSELMNAARASARRTSRSLAVMFVDLDRFKVINDTLGHEVGDQVLCEVGRRLRETLRESDVVARLGGDEFVVMIPELDDAAQAEGAARKALAALLNPMTIAGHELAVTASLGIALYPQDGEDEQALMKGADAAMYRAKEAGRNTFKFRGGESDRHALGRLAMETRLRRALERGEFFLLYQPRVSVASGTVTGVEALVRWRHPELGVVQPAEFIGLAEDTGAIHEIGRWVLGAACEQAARWRAGGLPPVRMAVNVSARQFAQDELLGYVSRALSSSALEADGLELEITESVVAQNVERATEVLAAVRRMGVRIALDDFGMGYSSLSQLKRFPVHTLKIDRAFVDDLPHDPDDAAIAQAILTMGRSLGLVVVAEGVETEAQRAFLTAHGCDELQGYLLSPPLEPEQCAAFVRRNAG